MRTFYLLREQVRYESLTDAVRLLGCFTRERIIKEQTCDVTTPHDESPFNPIFCIPLSNACVFLSIIRTFARFSDILSVSNFYCVYLDLTFLLLLCRLRVSCCDTCTMLRSTTSKGQTLFRLQRFNFRASSWNTCSMTSVWGLSLLNGCTMLTND